MPRCAMRYVGHEIVSTPFTRIEPCRRPTRPRIDFSVDVRPAPLRPRSVTTSPLRTDRSTPCSTCDSPYQAFNPEMRRTSPAPDRFCPGSAMRGPHVRLHHRGVRGDLGVGALGENGT